MTEFENNSLESILDELIHKYYIEPTNIYIFYSIRRVLTKIRKHKGIALKHRQVAWEFGFSEMAKRETKKKLAFVGHSFHAKTLSSMFFLRELDPLFDIDIYFSKSWDGIPSNYLSNLCNIYKYCVYWQIFPDLSYEHPSNVVVIPMWDGVSSWDKLTWLKYSRFNFLSFSKELDIRIKNYGLISEYDQHIPLDFINIQHKINKRTKPRVLLWQRDKNITWSLVKSKLISEQIGQIVLCNSSDPGMTFEEPSSEDTLEYNIEKVPWKASKNDYLNFLDDIDIFIAPRLLEGIGFSFLDAMSRGCVVVYTDASTMNEYLNPDIAFPINYKDSQCLDVSMWQEKQIAMIDYLNSKISSTCVNKVITLLEKSKC
jgi:glycosyltransferase involved in cell wall biosynthesis